MVSRFTKHLRTLSTKKSMKSSIIAITEDGATAAGVSCTPPSIRRKLSTKISARSKNQDKTRSVLNLMTRIFYLESLSRRYTSCSQFYKQGCLHRIDLFFLGGAFNATSAHCQHQKFPAQGEARILHQRIGDYLF